MANVNGVRGKYIVIFGVFLAVVSTELVLGDGGVEDQNYCSFFQNRAPTAQPNLKNCTWFKESSCCMQQEIKATFDKMKPLIGASLDCQRYINYLMCYICAPNQNVFYKSERLTVCAGFCDELYGACKSATLKGSVIRDLYPNGVEFCKSRRFEVNTKSCFTFDPSLDSRTSGSSTVRSVSILVVISFLCAILNTMNIDVSDKCSQTRKLKSNKQGISCKSRFEMRSLKLLFLSASLLISPVAAQSTEAAKDTDRLASEEVVHWAKIMSDSLQNLAEEGLHYDTIQQKYDNARYQQEAVNGSEKVQVIRQKLGTSTL